MIELFIIIGVLILFAMIFTNGIILDDKPGGIWIGMFGIIACVVILTTLECTRESRLSYVQETVREYSALVERVDAVSKTDDLKLKQLYWGMIADEVSEMNGRIYKHKAQYQSIWNGYRFSKEIANLRPINLQL